MRNGFEAPNRVDDSPGAIRIRVRAFALARQALGTGELEVSLPAGSTVADLLDNLVANYPPIHPLMGRLVVTVNRSFAARDVLLASGDEVAVFPPVSGGCEETYAAITPDPIDSSTLAAMVNEPGAGAVVLFVGVVRATNLGRPVEYLEYEAYPEMAEAKLRQVIDEARQGWPKIRKAAVVHRVGHLEVGEPAVIVAIGAPHRGDGAFEAARYAIDRIKEIVPIWKKEGWGQGETWLEGDYQPSPGE